MKNSGDQSSEQEESGCLSEEVKAAFIALSFEVSSIVLVASFDRSTFQLISHAHKTRLVCVILLVIMAWAFDALKLFFVVRGAAGEKNKLQTCGSP